MAITYQSEQVEFPPIKRRVISRWIKSVASSHQKKISDISYVFCSDEMILEINNSYLNHDYYTDIITFDYSDDSYISGDIFISLDTVRTNAEKFGTDFTDELNRVMIHGILHLCGINDKTTCEQELMTKCENEALTSLKQIIL